MFFNILLALLIRAIPIAIIVFLLIKILKAIEQKKGRKD